MAPEKDTSILACLKFARQSLSMASIQSVEVSALSVRTAMPAVHANVMWLSMCVVLLGCVRADAFRHRSSNSAAERQAEQDVMHPEIMTGSPNA